MNVEKVLALGWERKILSRGKKCKLLEMTIRHYV
jgi:hypothetical protein